MGSYPLGGRSACSRARPVQRLPGAWKWSDLITRIATVVRAVRRGPGRGRVARHFARYARASCRRTRSRWSTRCCRSRPVQPSAVACSGGETLARWWLDSGRMPSRRRGATHACRGGGGLSRRRPLPGRARATPRTPEPPDWSHRWMGQCGGSATRTTCSRQLEAPKNAPRAFAGVQRSHARARFSQRRTCQVPQHDVRRFDIRTRRAVPPSAAGTLERRHDDASAKRRAGSSPARRTPRRARQAAAQDGSIG